MMDITFKANEIRTKFPSAYRKLANWYTWQQGLQPPYDEAEEAMLLMRFSDINAELICHFLKDEGIIVRTCGGPFLGYGYCFQEDSIPEDFNYLSKNSALYGGILVALGRINM